VVVCDKDLDTITLLATYVAFLLSNLMVNFRGLYFAGNFFSPHLLAIYLAFLHNKFQAICRPLSFSIRCLFIYHWVVVVVVVVVEW